jgi:hypothetical protein
VGLVAFVVSLGAVAGAVVAWAVELGYAANLGIPLAVPIR